MTFSPFPEIPKPVTENLRILFNSKIKEKKYCNEL